MSILNTVEKLIKKHGRTGVSVERSAANNIDQNAPWKASKLGLDLIMSNLDVVILNEVHIRGTQGQGLLTSALQSFNIPSDTLMEGASALAYFIPSQVNMDIQPGDLVKSGSMAYTVLKVDILKPGDTTFLISAQLKE